MIDIKLVINFSFKSQLLNKFTILNLGQWLPNENLRRDESEF